jgi:hypothetical protein
VRVLAEERRTLRRSDRYRRHLGAAQVWFGRSQGEAPGVDGGIYFVDETECTRPGEFVAVTLRGHGPFDFFGDVTSQELDAVG